MAEAALELKSILEGVRILKPSFPVVSNYTAQPECDPDTIKESLVNQIKGSVRWEESMRLILSGGTADFTNSGREKF